MNFKLRVNFKRLQPKLIGQKVAFKRSEVSQLGRA